MTGKTSTAVKNRWNAKTYDCFSLMLPKGRKEEIEAYAKARGESVNGYINALIRVDMGMNGNAKKENK